MITNSKLVFKIDGKVTRNQVLEQITQKLVDEGFAKSKKSVLDGFKAREEQSTTGLSDGIAIPHVSSEAITEAKIVVARLSQATDWKAMDGQPTDFAIAIAVPANGRNDHFELLTAISTKLADPAFVKEFKKSSNKNIVDVLNNMKTEDEAPAKETKAKAGALKVVGVTTCVTGVAHTFIAAQALEDEGKRRGWDVKIERQGQMTKNTLTQKEIDEADYVIFGISKQIDGPERFNGKKTFTVEVAEPINKAKEVFDDMLEKSTVQQGKGGSTSTATGGAEQKASFMSHMMAGISFMIPYIAMAGITLGLTTAFGYKVFSDGNVNYAAASGFQPTSPFANALNTLAGGGFTLYIPILAMFIANSIAGRKAMAPAAILALVLNTAPDTSWAFDATGNQIANAVDATTAQGFAPFFNYFAGAHGGFYGWTSSPALGFLGAVVAGYMVGFGIQGFTKYTDKVDSMAFQAIVPLLILPILFTLVPWLFMAFVGYIPLYAISSGLNWAVSGLIDINMFWLAGGLMGAMICFDLGGPVNKIAMVIGSMMLSQGMASGDADLASVNGVCALAVSIPPTVLFFSNVGYRFTPLKMDEQDVTTAWTASLMGFFGITEGSIPFAAKDPKKWMPAFMVAGFIGGAIMGLFTQFGFGIIDNVPMWGGPIILLAGGYGSTAFEGMQAFAANWTWTLLYFIPLVIAGISGFLTASALEMVYSKKDKKEEAVKA